MTQTPNKEETPSDHDDDPGAPSSGRRMLSTVRTGAWYTARIVFPLDAITGTGKIAIHSLANTVRRGKAVFQQESAWRKEQLTFDQAVRESGYTVSQLRLKFTFLKRFWWLITLTCGGMTPALLVMVLLAAQSLPGLTLLRACTTTLVLTAITAVAATKVIICQYRRWQLDTRRLHPDEGGTFRAFRAEARWLRKTINPR